MSPHESPAPHGAIDQLDSFRDAIPELLVDADVPGRGRGALLADDEPVPQPPVDGVPAWWTLRRPVRRLTYHAAYRMFVRANAELGANWSLRDLAPLSLCLVRSCDCCDESPAPEITHGRVSRTIYRDDKG